MTPVQAVPIDAGLIDGFWPKVAPWVAAALPWARGRWTLESIHDDLTGDFKRLWCVFRDNQVISAVVTVNTDFPAVRVSTILLCGGADADSWVPLILRNIEAAARAEGCGQVEIIGRPGWRKLCPEYDLAGVWLVKELNR